MGLGPPKVMKKHLLFGNYSPVEAPPCRPERGAEERSLCGCSFLEMFFNRSSAPTAGEAVIPNSYGALTRPPPWPTAACPIVPW